MFDFITKRSVLVNILVAVVVSALLIFLLLESFEFFTQHGKYKKIPDVVGKSYNDAVKLLEQQGFDVEIQDSVFYDSLPHLSVIKQFPYPDATVKINRTVFLTINRAIPPEVDMPQLVGLTLRSAEMILRNSGLRLGDTTFRPDFARNSVLDQYYNGQKIAFGTKIRMGSSIDLLLGSGIADQEMNVPDLFGMTYADAKIILDSSSLTGAVVVDPDVKDTAAAFIYKQSPGPKNDANQNNRIRSGMSIDIYLGTQRPVRDTIN